MTNREDESKMEVTDAMVNSACMSYRHDFGLLPELDREAMRRTARWWLEAWQKEGLAFTPRPNIEAALEAYRDGSYRSEEQVHASVTKIVAAALQTSNAAGEPKGDALAELIKTRFLGVDPDDVDCVLEDHDWLRIIAALSTPSQGERVETPAPVTDVVPCPCTLIEQDESCPVGYPSLLCGICNGIGNTTTEQVTALACEMIKIASDIGGPEDPFAAWESIDLIQGQNNQMRKALLSAEIKLSRYMEVHGKDGTYIGGLAAEYDASLVMVRAALAATEVSADA